MADDMGPVIVPRSDQQNADDFLSGPRTIRITKVAVAPNTEQPVSIFFEGDGGKPYKPCKSMCRVMVSIWGPDSAAYAGKSMTIYRDPKVKWGGMEVGGIRISHMSGMDAPVVMALTETRASRKPFTVKPLRVDQARQPERSAPPPPASEPIAPADPEPPVLDAQEGPGDDVSGFPEDRPSATPTEDVVDWAVRMLRELPDYAGVEVLREDWSARKDELKERNPNMFKSLNEAVVARARELGA